MACRKKPIILFFLILSVIFCLSGAHAVVEELKREKPQEETEPAHVPGELIVKLKDTLDESQVHSLDLLNKKYGLISIEKVFKDILPKDKEGRPLAHHEEWYWYLDKGLSKEKREDTIPNLPAQEGQPVSESNLPNLSNIFILKFPQQIDVSEVAEKYSQDPNVEYAQPNYIRKVQVVPNDPYYLSSGSWGQPYADLWGLKKMQCEQAWDITKGQNVVVAVVDTGVDYNHEDLASNIWVNQDEVPGNGIDDDNNGFIDDVRGWDFIGGYYNDPQPDSDPMDVYGHGTHVAGTIAAVTNNSKGVAGVSWFSKIMPVRGLDDAGYGPDSQLAQCLVYAANNGADVINNSWGGEGESQVIKDAVRYAYNLGCVVVAAAGNNNADVKDFYPADIKEVITVSAFNHQDQKCSFSNYGVKVDVAAPGGGIYNEFGGNGDDVYNILSTANDNSSLTTSYPQFKVSSGYLRLAGTSMACPHVAGLAALILSKHPGFSNEEVRQVLRVSADDVDQAGWDINSGYGRINAYKAMQMDSVCIAYLNYPSQYDTLKGTVNILGTAKGSNFQRYFMEYGSGSLPTDWTLIGEIYYSPVTNGILFSWDTTYLNDGQYTLRLTVEDNQGRKFQDRVIVNTDNIKTQILIPEDGEVVRLEDNLAIKGDAWSEGLQEYLVEYSSDEGSTWFLIKRGTSSVINGILANWDTSSLPNETKEYRIRLTVRGQHLEDTNQISVCLDPTLHPGWPKNLMQLSEAQGMYVSGLSDILSPVVCDINADGSKELIAICPSSFTSRILIFNSEGLLLKFIDAPVTIETPIPTIADIDNDGFNEILFHGHKAPKEDWGKEYENWVFAYKYDGSQAKGWPVDLTTIDGMATVIPSLIIAKDLNLDGILEIIMLYLNGYHYDAVKGISIYHYYLYVFNNEGKVLPGWPKALFNAQGYLGNGFLLVSPFFGNFDEDPELEVGIGMPHPDGQIFVDNTKDGIIYLFNLDGSNVPGWPVEIIDYMITTSDIATGDINNDGYTELVANCLRGGWSTYFKVYCFDRTGQIMSGWPSLQHEYLLFPSLGDIDGDRDLEIFAQDSGYYFWHHDGQVVENYPSYGYYYGGNVAPVIADIDGDGSIDWLDAMGRWPSLYTYIVNYNLGQQKILFGFPKRMKRYHSPFLSICDIDNDGKIEIIAKSATDIYVWDLEGGYNPAKIEWPTFRRDLQRTALYLPYQAPSFLTIGNKTVYEGKSLEFTLKPSDPGRAEDWIYSVQSLPAGASFNLARRTFTWIPNFNQAGNYTVTFSVTDGVESSSQTINISVLNSVLRGRLISQDGSPIKGATINIKKQGSVVAQTITNNNGEYAVDADLSTGDYQIEIKANGCLPYSQDISLTQGQTATFEPNLSSAQSRIRDYQLLVQKQLPDGTFAPLLPYKIKGVCWSPSSIGNPGWDNIVEREREFANWYMIDVPLMKQMGVNTVRTYLDFGADDVKFREILDELYENGIMVIMTVDDGLNDTSNLEHVVQVFKDHPAILMWEIGNEWNLNFYYGKFADLESAAQSTEAAARRIKEIDLTHPVSSSLGDTGIYRNYPYPPCEIERIVNELCLSVDVWGLNLYRGNTFVDLFTQWPLISSKPFYISEFGTDSYNASAWQEDQNMQADWDALLWDEIYFNHSADNSDNTCLGGTIFEWNDEWWKQNYYNPWYQDLSGNYMPGHPDSYAHEEWFGIVGIGDLITGRQPKAAYATFKDKYIKNGAATKTDINLKVVSSGRQGGVIEFSKNGYTFYRKGGGGGGGRGINVTVVNRATGIIETIRHFDTYASKHEFRQLIDFVNTVENGKILVFGICDEAGFIDYRSGEPWQDYQQIIEETYQLLENLGSQHIREVGYWGAWGMVSIKGASTCLGEDYGDGEKSVEVNIILDTDRDGQDNNVDSDDDNDGLLDVNEISKGMDPLDQDTDDDGIKDNIDTNNFSPELASIGNRAINEGSFLQFQISATDIDGDALIYSAETLPQGASFTAQTFSWTPSYQQAGIYGLTFVVTDGVFTDSETITITVENLVIPPPTVSLSVYPATVTAGQPFTVTICGTSTIGLAGVWWFGDNTGVTDATVTNTYPSEPTSEQMFTTPVVNPTKLDRAFGSPLFTTAQAVKSYCFSSEIIIPTPGTYRFGANARDVLYPISGEAHQASEGIGIQVVEVQNQPPILATVGNQTVSENQLLSLSVSATDEDNDPLTYSAASLPAGASFIGQRFSWKPTYKQAGKYSVTFDVSDGKGNTDSETITVTVINVNGPPIVGDINPSNGLSPVNIAVTFTTTFSDPDGWQDIQYSSFLINNSLTFAKRLYAYYNQNTNKLYLRNNTNTAWAGGYAPGSSNIIKNSYAKLDCSKTTVSGSGDTLMVNWNITFNFASLGIKNIYLYVRDDSNAYDGWTKKGIWTIIK